LKPPVFRPLAAADVEEAYRWYQEQRSGLGDEFLEAVQLALQNAVSTPLAYPQVHRDKRRVLLRRFPYSLIYRLIEDQVVVLGCLHGRRHPRVIRKRT
jgi:plasmid stabilization system protein ParE